MTGLEKMIEKILARGREDARAILQGAEEACTELAADYAKRTEQARERIAAQSKEKGEQIVESARAEAEDYREKALAAARESVLSEVKAIAKKKLCASEQNKYRELLVGLLSSALIEQHRAERERVKKGESVAPVCRFEVVMSGADHDLLGSAVVEGARRLVERRIGADKAARVVLSHERLTIEGGMLLRFDDAILDYSLDTLLDEVCKAKSAELDTLLFRG